MWKLIVSIDKKMKTLLWYQVLTWMPRRCYRFAMALRKKWSKWKSRLNERILQLRQNITEWIEQTKERIEYLQSEEYRLIQIERKMEEGAHSPLVSVIMPVYNAEKYLREALDSLMSQSMKYFEILCVDDGSTDSSLSILREYASMDSRIRVLSQKNKYAGVARNRGMAKAKGEYLIFLDSDDYFDPELLKKVYYKAAVEQADIVLFGANYENMSLGQSGAAKWLLNVDLAPEKQPFSCHDCPDHIYQITTAVPWTKMFRRGFIRKTRLKFQSLHNANDVYFVYSAIALAKRICVLDEALVTYRMGLSSNLQSSQKRYFYEAYFAWKKKLIQIGCFETLKQSYVNAALSSVMYNFRKIKNEEAKKEMFHKIKSEMLSVLEISGYDDAYYYDKKNADEMNLILNSTFEEYLETLNHSFSEGQ